MKWFYTLRPRTPVELDRLAFTAFKAWVQPDTKEKEAREAWAAMHPQSREPMYRIVQALLEAADD